MAAIVGSAAAEDTADKLYLIKTSGLNSTGFYNPAIFKQHLAFNLFGLYTILYNQID